MTKSVSLLRRDGGEEGKGGGIKGESRCAGVKEGEKGGGEEGEGRSVVA